MPAPSFLPTKVIYCGDNLLQLPRLPDASVDLVYIDPPFNSNRNYEVFWGDAKETRAFNDRFGAVEKYIEYMRPRVAQLYRVLKPTGSFYYHCDWHADAYVRVMLDEIFGVDNFRTHVIWRRNAAKGHAFSAFPNNHDSIFYYTKSSEYTFNRQYLEHDPAHIASHYTMTEPETGRRYMLDNLINPNKNRPNLEYEFLGVKRVWRWTKERMQAAYEAGIVIQTKPGAVPRQKRYLDEQEGVSIDSLWADIPPINSQARESLGYPTQKPIALLKRILEASTNPGDVVLDAFCGCGTTLIAAETLGRTWIGIDISPTACRVMGQRLETTFSYQQNTNFYIHDLPKSIEELRKYPPFEFENWAVNLLGELIVNGRTVGNRKQVGDKGIDGRVYPVGAEKVNDESATLFGAGDNWLPIQVKQQTREGGKVGRPDIDSFETAMRRQKRTKGFFIAFDYSRDALEEVNRVWLEEGIEIIPVTVQELLDDQRRIRV